MTDLRKQEELPGKATTIHASLDGVMLRMNEKKQGDVVIEQGGWREASSTKPVVIDVETRQPTILRTKTLMTKAT